MIERYDVYDEASFQSAIIHVKNKLDEAQFDHIKAAQFLTAVSELARNIIKYAGKGAITASIIGNHPKVGIEVIASDNGPGIENLTLALQEKYSSSGTLGQGLPGARRLVDEFDISSSGRGTRIVISSWN